MFARILLIADYKFDPSNAAFRVCETLRREGHAVLACNPHDEEFEERLTSAFKTFKPSMVMVVVDSVQLSAHALSALVTFNGFVVVLSLQGNDEAFNAFTCRIHQVAREHEDKEYKDSGHQEECVENLIVVKDMCWIPDALYSKGRIADPNIDRAGTLLPQPWSEEAARAVARLEGRPQASEIVTLDDSWDSSKHKLMPGLVEAYWRRSTRYCVFFSSPSAPSAWDIAQAIAEGNLVLIEQKAARTLPGSALKDSLITFNGDAVRADGNGNAKAESNTDSMNVASSAGVYHTDSLEDILASFQQDPQKYQAAYGVQQSALATSDTLEISLRKIFTRLEDGYAQLKAQGNQEGCTEVKNQKELKEQNEPENQKDQKNQEERSAYIDNPLPYKDPASTIVVLGWLGAQNFGDDLLFDVVRYRLGLAIPNAEIVVIGADPMQLHKECGLEAYEPGQKAEIDYLFKRARAMVCLGGLLFDDPMGQTAGAIEFALNPWIEPSGQAAIVLQAKSLGVPTVYFGAGCGPLETFALKRMVYLMGLAHTRFIMRDQESCDLVRACGVPEEDIFVSNDLIFGAKPYIDEVLSSGVQSLKDILDTSDIQVSCVRDGGAACDGATQHSKHSNEALSDIEKERIIEKVNAGEYFMVSLRTWHTVPDDFVASMASALGSIQEACKCVIIFVPFGHEDVDIHREVMNALPNGTEALSFNTRPDDDAILRLISMSKGSVAMRLHCSILHLVMGKPAVGLDYNPKIAAQFDSLGLSRYVLPMDVSADELAQVTVDAFSTDTETTIASKSIIAKCADLQKSYAQLFSIIDSVPPYYEKMHFAHGDGVGNNAGNTNHDSVGNKAHEDSASNFYWTSLSDPDLYYPRNIGLPVQRLLRAEAVAGELTGERDAARDEVTNVYQSNSYKIGNLFMKPLSAIKGLLSRNR